MVTLAERRRLVTMLRLLDMRLDLRFGLAGLGLVWLGLGCVLFLLAFEFRFVLATFGMISPSVSGTLACAGLFLLFWFDSTRSKHGSASTTRG